MQIYHDGSHSYINESGTGALKILASQLEINNAANSENAFSNFSMDFFEVFQAIGPVSLLSAKIKLSICYHLLPHFCRGTHTVR